LIICYSICITVWTTTNWIWSFMYIWTFIIRSNYSISIRIIWISRTSLIFPRSRFIRTFIFIIIKTITIRIVWFYTFWTTIIRFWSSLSRTIIPVIYRTIAIRVRCTVIKCRITFFILIMIRATIKFFNSKFKRTIIINVRDSITIRIYWFSDRTTAI